jgi:hypothetical protein
MPAAVKNQMISPRALMEFAKPSVKKDAIALWEYLQSTVQGSGASFGRQ